MTRNWLVACRLLQRSDEGSAGDDERRSEQQSRVRHRRSSVRKSWVFRSPSRMLTRDRGAREQFEDAWVLPAFRSIVREGYDEVVADRQSVDQIATSSRVRTRRKR